MIKYVLVLLFGSRWLYFYHDWIIWGHPREDVTWGTVAEGALCKCGERFYLGDFQG